MSLNYSKSLVDHKKGHCAHRSMCFRFSICWGQTAASVSHAHGTSGLPHCFAFCHGAISTSFVVMLGILLFRVCCCEFHQGIKKMYRIWECTQARKSFCMNFDVFVVCLLFCAVTLDTLRSQSNGRSSWLSWMQVLCFRSLITTLVAFSWPKLIANPPCSNTEKAFQAFGGPSQDCCENENDEISN